MNEEKSLERMEIEVAGLVVRKAAIGRDCTLQGSTGGRKGWFSREKKGASPLGNKRKIYTKLAAESASFPNR